MEGWLEGTADTTGNPFDGLARWGRIMIELEANKLPDPDGALASEASRLSLAADEALGNIMVNLNTAPKGEEVAGFYRETLANHSR